jgi:hypothetical protein
MLLILKGFPQVVALLMRLWSPGATSGHSGSRRTSWEIGGRAFIAPNLIYQNQPGIKGLRSTAHTREGRGNGETRIAVGLGRLPADQHRFI